MASMAREAWTDERLDDLKGSVDRLDQRVESGFAEMREEIRAGRAEMREELKAGRAETREEIDGVRGDIREIRAEMGALNRTIHQFMFVIVGTIFLGFMGTIAALATLA
jgi:chromosome segregation ATPase